MCCPLDQMQGKFISVDILKDENNITLSGKVDFTPQNFGGRCIRIFQRLELAEKIAEVVDEGYHLFGSFIKLYASTDVLDYIKGLHHAAHHIEHGLHAFCFIGDVVRVFSGKFIERDHDQVDYVRTAARVAHTISHFLATANFLSDLKVCKLGRLEPYVKYGNLISSVAYGIWTLTILWKHFRSSTSDKQISSDLSIHGGGCLFEALNYVKTLDGFASSNLSKAAAIAGIIHAWSVAARLMPDESEIRIRLHNNNGNIQYVDRHHHHHHSGECHHQ